MLTPSSKAAAVDTREAASDGCAWWNLICQGGEKAADSGLSAITHSIIDGLVALFGGITKIVDESTQVPLADPTYRDTYVGFVGLAIPIIAVVYLVALLAAAIRRDPRTLIRATVGVAVAAIGGAVYVVFAQLLVALDDWLAHGVVAVTGADFGDQMRETAGRFSQMGAGGEVAANMLMIVLMFAALIAGVFLWVLLLLRKIAILVVVVFAPLLMAGWLWAPTRAWSRKATEVLIALVFCKTVIYVIFGVGMSLLFRGSAQTLSDLVGVIVLLCGACFAPLVTLRLVHFATDSQIAGEMFGTMRAGAQPTADRLRRAMPHRSSRNDMARDYARSDRSSRSMHRRDSGGPKPAKAATAGTQSKATGGAAGTGTGPAGSSPGGAGKSAGGGGASGAAAAAGMAGSAGKAAAKKTAESGARGTRSMGDLAQSKQTPSTDGSKGPTSRGPKPDDT